MPEQKREGQEFELVPLSPIRRLEKRLEAIETKHEEIDSKEFYKELVDIIRLNQQLVDELAKSNDALRIELSRLPGRLEDLSSKVNELVSFIKASASEEVEAVSADFQPLTDKITELVDLNKKILETNKSMLSALEDLETKIKKPPIRPPPQLLKKPLLFPPKPV